MACAAAIRTSAFRASSGRRVLHLALGRCAKITAMTDSGATTTTITAIVAFGAVVSIGVRVIPSIKNAMPRDGSSQSRGQ